MKVLDLIIGDMGDNRNVHKFRGRNTTCLELTDEPRNISDPIAQEDDEGEGEASTDREDDCYIKEGLQDDDYVMVEDD